MLIWLTPLQMSLYGGLAVLAALAVRTAGRRRLPSGVLSWLWLLAALRFLLPVSVSGPASVDVSVLLPLPPPGGRGVAGRPLRPSAPGAGVPPAGPPPRPRTVKNPPTRPPKRPGRSPCRR